MKPQFKTLSQHCSGYIGPIPGHNVKSNKRGFSFMKLLLLHFGFKATGCEWSRPVVETPHFLLSGRSLQPQNQPTDSFCGCILQTTIRDSFCHINFGLKGRKRGGSLSARGSVLCECDRGVLI